MKPPPPGSDAAIKLGCKCAVLDNGHGAGVYTDSNGVLQFWISCDCPLHGELKESCK